MTGLFPPTGSPAPLACDRRTETGVLRGRAVPSWEKVTEIVERAKHESIPTIVLERWPGIAGQAKKSSDEGQA